ncbi:hypothetical protein [Streptomyces oceani]|uniref:hypothetical protein n=1 Tax=Streptomyces oceani TaxID=1075402 RepID=UPI001BAF6FE5|nr:hypothetical protein [Streptomyces oceani]
MSEADDHGRAVSIAGDQGLGMVGEVLVEIPERDTSVGPSLGDGSENFRLIELG